MSLAELHIASGSAELYIQARLVTKLSLPFFGGDGFETCDYDRKLEGQCHACFQASRLRCFHGGSEFAAVDTGFLERF
jgi:hypothetical protein